LTSPFSLSFLFFSFSTCSFLDLHRCTAWGPRKANIFFKNLFIYLFLAPFSFFLFLLWIPFSSNFLIPKIFLWVLVLAFCVFKKNVSLLLGGGGGGWLFVIVGVHFLGVVSGFSVLFSEKMFVVFLELKKFGVVCWFSVLFF
jgi:hypothetical protein